MKKFNSYTKVLDFLFESLPMYQRVGKSAYKSNLDNTLKLDAYFNLPHKDFKTIHIAGTNGKGSVSHILASVFQQAGYKTGLYTSPHLFDYRERIRINGEMICKDFVTNFINSNYKFIKKIQPSFFEMSVALAFDYFKDNSVDIAVIEVGMGGRLDSTNIINPLLSIITNIGMDHTFFLGDSLKKIAIEKAGIIKNNVPVIIGETNNITGKVFKKIAKNKKSEILFADKEVLIKSEGDFVYYELKNEKLSNKFIPDLKGNYQKKNFPIAILSANKLKSTYKNIKDKTILKALENVIKNTGIRGRWEILSKKPLIICDTAHNKEGLEIVFNQINSLKFKKLHIVLGFVNDKNISEILSVFPKNAIYYFTQAKIPRALSCDLLIKEAEKFNLKGCSYNTITEAYSNAQLIADKDDLIFIGGSTFTVGELLESIE